MTAPSPRLHQDEFSAQVPHDDVLALISFSFSIFLLKATSIEKPTDVT